MYCFRKQCVHLSKFSQNLASHLPQEPNPNHDPKDQSKLGNSRQRNKWLFEEFSTPMTLFCVCTHFLKAVASTCKLREYMHVHAITFLFCMHMHPFIDFLGHGPGCFLALWFITGSNFCSSISKDQALQFRLYHSFVTFCLRNHQLNQAIKGICEGIVWA